MHVLYMKAWKHACYHVLSPFSAYSFPPPPPPPPHCIVGLLVGNVPTETEYKSPVSGSPASSFLFFDEGCNFYQKKKNESSYTNIAPVVELAMHSHFLLNINSGTSLD